MPGVTEDKAIEHLESVRKKRTALELRLKKYSYRAIADELGVSVSTVTIWIKEQTQTLLPQEEAAELRAHEAASYDESEKRILALMELCARDAARRAEDNQPYGYQLEQLERFETVLINVRKQRAMLLGINVPVTVKHNVTVRTEFDAKVEALVSELTGGGNLMTSPDMVDVGDEHA
jgi:transposase